MQFNLNKFGIRGIFIDHKYDILANAGCLSTLIVGNKSIIVFRVVLFIEFGIWAFSLIKKQDAPGTTGRMDDCM